MGAKRPLNGERKCDKQTHIPTFWLIENIGPEGPFFEEEQNNLPILFLRTGQSSRNPKMFTLKGYR